MKELSNVLIKCQSPCQSRSFRLALTFLPDRLLRKTSTTTVERGIPQKSKSKSSIMDPKQPASAPPMGWSEDKSSVLPPPPYQDNPGLAQPGPGYPPQGYGYQPQYGGPGYGQQPYPAGQQYPGQQYPGQQYPGQPATVAVQPTVYVTQAPLANPVNDYLCYSIFTMICCCLPLGIAALIYSVSAREANLMGNRVVAEQSSRTARTLNHVALGLGIGGIILCIVYVVVMASVISH